MIYLPCHFEEYSAYVCESDEVDLLVMGDSTFT